MTKSRRISGATIVPAELGRQAAYGCYVAAHMSRRALTWAVFFVGVISVVGGFIYLTREPEVVRTDPVELEEQANENRRARNERWEAIGAESRDLIPDIIEGVELGMSLTQAQQRRPRMQRNPATTTNPEAKTTTRSFRN